MAATHAHIWIGKLVHIYHPTWMNHEMRTWTDASRGAFQATRLGGSLGAFGYLADTRSVTHRCIEGNYRCIHFFINIFLHEQSGAAPIVMLS